MSNKHRKKGVLDMRNTEINRLEKENNTRGKNTMIKNQIRQALIDLGFENIEGWYHSHREGENRFCTGEYDTEEIEKMMTLLSKCGTFNDGERFEKVDLNAGADNDLGPLYAWYIITDEHKTYISEIRYVNVEFRNKTLVDIEINHCFIENGVEYGPVSWGMY